MKKDFYGDLSAYRISRSKETFEEALIMQREEHWNACMNRSVLCCILCCISTSGQVWHEFRKTYRSQITLQSAFCEDRKNFKK